jgi:putative tryptophan/tyrosine transport system substrate-binding protein
MPVVGFLNSGSSTDGYYAKNLSGLREGLNAAGYVEGQNVTVDFRWAEGAVGALEERAKCCGHLAGAGKEEQDRR